MDLYIKVAPQPLTATAVIVEFKDATPIEINTVVDTVERVLEAAKKRNVAAQNGAGQRR